MSPSFLRRVMSNFEDILSSDLTEREKEAVERRFIDKDKWTEMAQKMEISTRRAMQLVKKAMVKLRRPEVMERIRQETETFPWDRY